MSKRYLPGKGTKEKSIQLNGIFQNLSKYSDYIVCKKKVKQYPNRMKMDIKSISRNKFVKIFHF